MTFYSSMRISSGGDVSFLGSNYSSFRELTTNAHKTIYITQDLNSTNGFLLLEFYLEDLIIDAHVDITAYGGDLELQSLHGSINATSPGSLIAKTHNLHLGRDLYIERTSDTIYDIYTLHDFSCNSIIELWGDNVPNTNGCIFEISFIL